MCFRGTFEGVFTYVFAVQFIDIKEPLFVKGVAHKIFDEFLTISLAVEVALYESSIDF
jgi:hypothetical protein